WNEDRDAPLLDGLTTIYVIIEPDRGGESILRWLRRSTIAARTRLVKLGAAKDPNGLHLLDQAAFPTAFQQALDAAEQYVPPPDPKPKDTGPKAGRPLILREPEPWPDLVDGAQLLDELVAAQRRYVVLGSA